MRNFVENFLAHLTVKTACIYILCEESYPLLNESHCASENAQGARFNACRGSDEKVMN